MKKYSTLLLLSVLLVVGLVCSCSSTPEHGKLIPKDASVVFSLNLEKAYEASGITKEQLPVSELSKLLKESTLSAPAREKLENIIASPEEAGIDLQEPMMVFYAPSFKSGAGVVGAVSKSAKLEELIDAMAREALCTKVARHNDLRYTVIGDAVLAFNDDWFLLAGQWLLPGNAEETLAGMEGLFKQEEKQSLYASELYEKMCDCPGFFQTLVQGEGLQAMLEKENLPMDKLMKSLPEGVALSDFAYLTDVSMGPGEANVVGEVLPLSSGAEKFVTEAKGSTAIAGDFLKYVPANAWLILSCGIDGKPLYDQMVSDADMKALLASNPVVQEGIEKLVPALKGDYVLALTGFVPGAYYPEGVSYAQAQNDSWLGMIEKYGAGEKFLTKKDGKNYSILVRDASETGSGAFYVDFGSKGGVSYALFGENPEPFKMAETPVTTLGEGCNFYFRFNVSPLLASGVLEKGFTAYEYRVAKKIIGLFDYVEAKVENNRKYSLRVVMTDATKTPVSAVYDEVYALVKAIL